MLEHGQICSDHCSVIFEFEFDFSRPEQHAHRKPRHTLFASTMHHSKGAIAAPTGCLEFARRRRPKLNYCTTGIRSSSGGTVLEGGKGRCLDALASISANSCLLVKSRRQDSATLDVQTKSSSSSTATSDNNNHLQDLIPSYSLVTRTTIVCLCVRIDAIQNSKRGR